MIPYHIRYDYILEPFVSTKRRLSGFKEYASHSNDTKSVNSGPYWSRLEEAIVIEQTRITWSRLVTPMFLGEN
jgi:hypothetical protein